MLRRPKPNKTCLLTLRLLFCIKGTLPQQVRILSENAKTSRDFHFGGSKIKVTWSPRNCRDTLVSPRHPCKARRAEISIAQHAMKLKSHRTDCSCKDYLAYRPALVHASWLTSRLPLLLCGVFGSQNAGRTDKHEQQFCKFCMATCPQIQIRLLTVY